MKYLLKIKKLESSFVHFRYILTTANLDNMHTIISIEDVTLDTLESCDNIDVIRDAFRDNMQDPLEYISAQFDTSIFITDDYVDCFSFYVTHLYYDSDDNIQLFRTINPFGKIDIHDVSEWECRKEYSVYGNDLENMPSFVQKDTLMDAYQWWKYSKNEGDNLSFYDNGFEIYEFMPIKLIYHYLVGVLGFQLGYHVAYPNNSYFAGEIHEYMLVKGSANLKLIENVDLSCERDDAYNRQRTLWYYRFRLSFLCKKEQEEYLKSLGLTVKDYDSSLCEVYLETEKDAIKIYERLYLEGLIVEEWRPKQTGGISDTLLHNLIPLYIYILNSKYEAKKHRDSTNFNKEYYSCKWMKAASLVACKQFYSDYLLTVLNPIFDSYSEILNHYFREMLYNMGSRRTFMTMRWTYRNLLKTIEGMRYDDGIINSPVVPSSIENNDKIFSFCRNDLDVPDWLKVYSRAVIEELGGVEFIKKMLSEGKAAIVKRTLTELADAIEEKNPKNLKARKGYIKIKL